MSGVEFRLLGPLEVVSDGRVVSVSALKHRILLAVLLLRANQLVPIRDIAERLWDDRAPEDPRGAVQKYVMRLRRVLAPAGCAIHTEPEGYRLETAPGTVDLQRFEDLVGRGERAADEGERTAASALLTEALTLWRASPPLSNVASEALQRDEVPRLQERYLQITELRIELDLELGRHAALSADLLGLTREHPLRERFWVQRMRALYGAHRQGEALEAYRVVTRLLANDLGVDPGPELRAVHEQILRGEHAPAPDRPAGWTPPQARQLPMPDSGIVGRRWEIDEVVDVLQVEGGGPRLVVVTGEPGTGKTAVALQAAHRLADRFPDGQLFADLGSPPQPEGAHPDDVLPSFLRALGVPRDAVPEQPREAVALYRSLTAGRRLLVVLDGVTSASRVRALLPGSSTGAVLVTSRAEPAELRVSPGCHVLAVGPLAPALGSEVLRAAIGDDRVRTEQTAAVRLVARCRGLPRALRAAGARLAATGQSIASYLDELADVDPVAVFSPERRMRSLPDAAPGPYRRLGGRAG